MSDEAAELRGRRWLWIALLAAVALMAIELSSVYAGRARLAGLCSSRELPKIYDQKAWTRWSSAVRRLPSRGPDGEEYRQRLAELAELGATQNVVQHFRRFRPYSFPFSSVTVTDYELRGSSGRIAKLSTYHASIFGPFQQVFASSSARGWVCTTEIDRERDLQSNEFMPLIGRSISESY